MTGEAFQLLLQDVQAGKVKPLVATAQLKDQVKSPVTVIANQMTYLGRGDSTPEEVSKHLLPNLTPEFDPFQL